MSAHEKDVELIEVVRTTLLRKGRGTPDDPVRRVIQYWSLDGELLAEVDDLGPRHCNGIGHVVWPGDAKCKRCDARFGEKEPERMP